ncbi:hypothetical protein GE09DRAFT_781478 [Coniochaeta sp. 2T2.1]|nr:hypothetical protein GE09DRAFT_781478 [Coniochaeta sp. 2T2.1]
MGPSRSWRSFDIIPTASSARARHGLDLQGLGPCASLTCRVDACRILIRTPTLPGLPVGLASHLACCHQSPNSRARRIGWVLALEVGTTWSRPEAIVVDLKCDSALHEGARCYQSPIVDQEEAEIEPATYDSCRSRSWYWDGRSPKCKALGPHRGCHVSKSGMRRPSADNIHTLPHEARHCRWGYRASDPVPTASRSWGC